MRRPSITFSSLSFVVGARVAGFEGGDGPPFDLYVGCAWIFMAARANQMICPVPPNRAVISFLVPRMGETRSLFSWIGREESPHPSGPATHPAFVFRLLLQVFPLARNFFLRPPLYP